jgi:ABC-2 type transport system ATP-binding protein
LPETPPLYPEMSAAEYLEFVGKLKGLSGSMLRQRIDFVLGRCSIEDVKNRQLGKLSKGYRQRVGLAQAIIHNPDVLILDEPTSGLDPKQVYETRGLIKSLAGDHTIILSTHILSEVEQTCEQVIIINRGKLVTTDTVHHLQSRARGVESVHVEVAARSGALDLEAVQRRLSEVSGGGQITVKETHGDRAVLEVENRGERSIRGDLSRAVVEAGWDLNEIRSAALSLEEVFLELTRDTPPAEAPALETVEKGAAQ